MVSGTLAQTCPCSVTFVILITGFAASPSTAADPPRPLIVAHRGLLRHAPENTLSNFRACLELRLGFEFDVRRTKDGTLVCVHDDSVARTTDGTGKVADLTLDEIRRLDAGSWFRPEFIGEWVPTVEEVLRLVSEYRQHEFLLAVDLKADDVAADVVRLAEKHAVLDKLLFIGTTISEPEVRRQIRSTSQKAHVAAVANTPDEFEQALFAPDADWVYFRFLPTKEHIEQVRRDGKRSFIAGATVAGNLPDNWRRSAEVGLDAVLTDYPLEMRKALGPDSDGGNGGKPTASAQIERVWLSHRSSDPSKIVVNWTSVEPGDSFVWFGKPGENVEMGIGHFEPETLHHVEIPAPEKGTEYLYWVSTGEQRSTKATLKAYPTDELRVAIVANWQGKPDLSALLKDEPHLLLTAGDNVANIHGECEEGSITPFAELIDAYPDLFRSVPFLPVLGNHDKEVRPRGDVPPLDPVYDIEARSFRKFFELPGDEWKWHFDVPEFDVRFIALDLNHVSDFGTWQSCHAFDQRSEQFRWYRDLMSTPDRPDFVVTLYNEWNSTVRGLADGAWWEQIREGTIAVSGFGHFAERAEDEWFPFYNTSLRGNGVSYPAHQSKILKNENSYLLLTFRNDANRVKAELKSLSGDVLDRRPWPVR